MKINIIVLTLLGFFLIGCKSENNHDENKRNVVFIIGDDYSYGEHGNYGNEFIKTPNIDALASSSVSFENFHVAATCSPSRAQLMSGKHEFRVGVTHTKYPRAYLNLDEKLLPEYFREAGYTTGHFGKWHLGNDVFDDEYSARSRGFETSLVSHYREHFNPDMMLNGKMISYKGYRTDILFDEAAKWIDNQLQEKKSFFCYIATNSAHGPFDCPDEFKEQYLGTQDIKKRETYYGMISNIDMNVGKIINQLKKKGIYENTLLIYMTDNGHVLGGYNAGMRGSKGSQYRGGTRVPCYFHCPEYFEGNRVVDELTGGIDFLPTLSDLCQLNLEKKVDGKSLVPLLLDDNNNFSDRFMVCHVGRWKDGKFEDNKYKKYAIQNKRFRLVDNKYLFDIKNDPNESINVLDQYPELVQKMREFYEDWWMETVPMMVNEERAVLEGGSRLSIEDVEFRKKQDQK
ncbi:arylsulfatase [Neotamlana laminarinivorans]|uniref:Arylsulfatase n=1 Tax=Neotamlana laminarinivorans TaxID=2883124 RepID=A0A9X1L0R7_9FLAO|nr:arylsulfatase [Tamlana laminarinivorans]MCB4797880.1 arylsulfatase [Tamlana laminarinivorans]